MALISLQTAKAHLRITTEEADADIYAKKQQAEAIVLDRCNTTAAWRTTTATWTESTLPGAVQAAMLLMLTHLYEQQGSDPQATAAVDAAVMALISPQYKDQVFA